MDRQSPQVHLQGEWALLLSLFLSFTTKAGCFHHRTGRGAERDQGHPWKTPNTSKRSTDKVQVPYDTSWHSQVQWDKGLFLVGQKARFVLKFQTSNPPLPTKPSKEVKIALRQGRKQRSPSFGYSMQMAMDTCGFFT